MVTLPELYRLSTGYRSEKSAAPRACRANTFGGQGYQSAMRPHGTLFGASSRTLTLRWALN